jgi:hypothetical protein
MDEQLKIKLANEIRIIVVSLNGKITEAYQQQIITTITQESGYYSRVSGTPGLISVDIREEHVL